MPRRPNSHRYQVEHQVEPSRYFYRHSLEQRRYRYQVEHQHEDCYQERLRRYSYPYEA